MKEYKEYIKRKIVKETPKAYMVEVEVNNRRDGWHTNFKWVGKSICKNLETVEFYNEVTKWVDVPTWIIGDCCWG